MFTAGSATAETHSLCTDLEKTVFSFQESKSKKLTSICKGTKSEYLVYRFGRKEKVELQYPAELNESSWKKFEFYGRRRPGGKMNAGFGDYTLSFENGQVQYVVFQEWSDEDDTYSIGVHVDANGKTTVLKGNKNTQQGSLVLLESESQHIRNKVHE
jgi:hypothetical protein